MTGLVGVLQRHRCRAWLRAHRRAHPAARLYPRSLCRPTPGALGDVVLNGTLVHLDEGAP